MTDQTRQYPVTDADLDAMAERVERAAAHIPTMKGLHWIALGFSIVGMASMAGTVMLTVAGHPVWGGIVGLIGLWCWGFSVKAVPASYIAGHQAGQAHQYVRTIRLSQSMGVPLGTVAMEDFRSES